MKQFFTKTKGLSDRAITWLFVTPTIILLLAVNIYPLVYAISMSFTNFYANKPGREIAFVGIKNYINILNKEDIWETMQATAHFMFWTLLLQALIGLGLALLLNKKFKGNEILTTVIVLPMMLSPAVVAVFWTYIYQPQSGIFNYIINYFYDFGEFTMIGDVQLAPWSIVIVDTWMWTPFTMLICLAGLRSVPNYLYEAASIDGANKRQLFFAITLPQLKPVIMSVVLLDTIWTLNLFPLIWLLTGGGPLGYTDTIATFVYRYAFIDFQFGRASAAAVVGLLVTMIFTFFYVRRQRMDV